jgi:hypothetical protein
VADSNRTSRARPAHWLLLIALALATAVAARAAWLALTHRVALVLVLGPLAWLLLASCIAAAPIAAWSLVDAARDRSPDSRATWRSTRVVFTVLVIGWLAFLVWVQPFQLLWFEIAAGIAAGLACASVLAVRCSRLASSRAFRVAEISLISLCASLVLAELGLRALAALHPMPILARAGEGPRRTIERFRCAPGTLRFGFACNARGFYDEELHPLPAGERWIASIGDSFSLGAVPHALHYTTVAERELGIPIDNIGVAGIGPPEYLSLLLDEALPRGPSAVVIALFVGNDLVFESPAAGRPHPWLRSWLERERVLLATLPRRLSRLAGEREAAQELAHGEVLGAAPDAAARGQALPWLDDPLREPPSLSSEAFLRLETARALDVCAGDPPALPELFALLREARRVAGATPLHVLLIPDEFQVEDELWAAVQRRAGRPLERDRPQRVLGAWLDREGIAYLDLLPRLRAVTPLSDGRRHVYHLQDTHFNARGNRIAGEALAEFLAGQR